MKYFKGYLSLLLLVVVVCACAQPQKAGALRILFIGNSYTYYNSTPELVKAFIQEKFPDQTVETRLISGGGMTLANHWQEEATIEAIRTGDWDYVVLQEQSRLGMGVMIDNETYFGPTDQFFEHARKFDAEIKASGAKTIFFMTWSRRDQPGEQAILTHAYATIAKELGAMVAPVGLVWDEVRTDPNMDLYADDGGHPSPAGSYLASATLFATLMGEDPQGLPGTISGKRLLTTGETSPETIVLVDLSKEDARSIQQESWEVVKAMKRSDDHLSFSRPEPGYTIPVLPAGETMALKDMEGKWYGTGTYGADYLGQILEVKDVGGAPEVSLSFYSPHREDQMRVDRAVIDNDRLTLTLYDSLRTVNATLSIALIDGKMKGLLETSGNFKMYKHLNFSGSPVLETIDLSALAAQMESFRKAIAKDGYSKAALKHYEEYSKLIGEPFQPEEFYLNAMGYNFLRDDMVEDALNRFELAMVYYPESVNACDSYAEALLAAGRKEEALAIYTRAYELAKKTGYENLSYIESNLNKLKNNIAIDPEGEAAPPPPPPPQ